MSCGSFHLNKQSFLDEGRRIKNDLWFISIIALFTQVGFQQIGLKKQYSPHATPTVLT
jgi:hypothetical protein